MSKRLQILLVLIVHLFCSVETWAQLFEQIQTNDSVSAQKHQLTQQSNGQERALQLGKLSETLLFFQAINEKEFVQLRYPGVAIKQNDSGEHIVHLKKKLQLMGLLNQTEFNPIFDDTLLVAVKKFQQMHNLTNDGVVGKNTYLFLNSSLNSYIKSIEKNMARYQQQSDTLPETRIEINIPEYALRYYHKGTLMSQFAVIVGKYDTKTPELYSEINYLVFNPCWTVPRSITVKKILPRLKRDSLYLDNRNMFVCIDGVRQNHREIDFTTYTASNFPYKVFQNASPANALGKVKFMFDNSHTVYLHDTPSKYLFNKDFRNFSNGCIRVKRALALAENVLANDENSASIKDKLAPGYPVKVYLNKPIPIIIHYFTARYNPELKLVQFYRDCYYKD